MKEREALFRVAVEYVSDGIVAIDEQGTIILFNPAAERLFGCKAFEVIGQPVTVLVPEPHRQELGEYIRGQLRTGQGKTIGFARELTGLRKQGETFHLDIAVNEGGGRGSASLSESCETAPSGKRPRRNSFGFARRPSGRTAR
jgi:PAS domain S-box-containing protein